MITVTVKNKMQSDVISIDKEALLSDAAKLMVEKSIGSLIILNGIQPIGMLTERDILRAYVNEKSTNGSTKVSKYMSTPLITINDKASLGNAAQKMLMKDIRRLGVLNDKNEIVGFVNIRDLIRGVHESFIALFEV